MKTIIVFEAKLRDSPLDEEWCDRLNEANDEVREAIDTRDKLQIDHKRVTKLFQKSDRIMTQYLLNQKSKIEKCQAYFELRKVIRSFESEFSAVNPPLAPMIREEVNSSV